MDNLFLALFLLCCVALIVGLVRPQAVVRWGAEETRTRKNVLKYYGLGLIASFILFGVTVDGTQTPTASSPVATTPAVTTPDKTPEQIAAEKAAYEKQQAELAAQKAAEEKLAAEKAEAERVAAEAAAKVAYDTGITYNQLARTPDPYKFKKVKFTGDVIQVMEVSNSETDLRIAVNGNYDTVLLAYYDPKISPVRVLEGDNISVKGVSQGLHSYTATFGQKITLPIVSVDILTIN